MRLTDIVEVVHSRAPRFTTYHEACYLPLAKFTDIVIRLIGVPDYWPDPGCAQCHCALATHPESPQDKQIERDFLRTIDSWEREYRESEYTA
jgi:hypothetical protein